MIAKSFNNKRIGLIIVLVAALGLTTPIKLALKGLGIDAGEFVRESEKTNNNKGWLICNYIEKDKLGQSSFTNSPLREDGLEKAKLIGSSFLELQTNKAISILLEVYPSKSQWCPEHYLDNKGRADIVGEISYIGKKSSKGIIWRKL